MSIYRSYPIVGIKPPRPLRYEIRQFTNPKFNKYAKTQLNMFLLALEMIQTMSREERLSWFQICGIHGMPYVTWDGSKGSVDPGEWGGYCTHASILFPTWHRVYVALIEQAVHACMNKIVKLFPPDQQEEIQIAVDHWRYPYWDWALADADTRLLDVPELMRIPRIQIQRPDGSNQTIDNPLYRYAFPLNNEQTIDGIDDVTEEVNRKDFRIPYSKTPFTVRHPAMYDQTIPFSANATWAQGISNNDLVVDSLNNGEDTQSKSQPGGQQLVQQVMDLFTKMRGYPAFSNTAWSRSGNINDYASLEGVHNNVHNFIGGMTFGHMSESEVAAFDPAFWMHHGNIERLLSIFQALNPPDHMEWPDDAWLQGVENPWFTGIEEDDQYGTWTTPAGMYETTTSPLTPFHKDIKGTVYDSDGCRYIKNFGYSFEELQDWKSEFMLPDGRFNTPLYCKTIREKLKEKYGWAEHSHRVVCALARHVPFSKVPHNIPPHQFSTVDRQFDEYIVNVRVDRFANGGQTFAINFFLGEVPSDVAQWEKCEKLGVVSVFGGARFAEGKCANCSRQAANETTRLITGQFPITAILLDLIKNEIKIGMANLTSLNREHVGDFLKNHMHWGVVGLGNKEIDIQNIPSLKVFVSVAQATLPVDRDEFVKYGKHELIEKPTTGRGWNPDNDKI